MTEAILYQEASFHHADIDDPVEKVHCRPVVSQSVS